MNNYEYIISSLPVISSDASSGRGIDCDGIVTWIKEQCSKKDNKLIDTLLSGFDESALTEDFYRSALSSRNRFIKEYFTLDLKVRNAKVRYLNRRLERPADQDIFMDPELSFEEKNMIPQVFETGDLLARERAVDDMMWDRIGSLVLFDYFDINVILAFIAKLHIISRWLSLDEEKGREMFRQLVGEVRGTFKGVEYDEK